MTARQEVEAAFNASHERIRERTGPPGVAMRDDVDQRMVIINETNHAIQEALYALADRIDRLEGK
jgi:hypothetical protein